MPAADFLPLLSKTASLIPLNFYLELLVSLRTKMRCLFPPLSQTRNPCCILNLNQIPSFLSALNKVPSSIKFPAIKRALELGFISMGKILISYALITMRAFYLFRKIHPKLNHFKKTALLSTFFGMKLFVNKTFCGRHPLNTLGDPSTSST